MTGHLLCPFGTPNNSLGCKDAGQFLSTSTRSASCSPSDICVFVPSGTLDNSPPIRRWRRRDNHVPKSLRDGRCFRDFDFKNAEDTGWPEGGMNGCVVHDDDKIGNDELASKHVFRPWRDLAFCNVAIPPLKRWAIVGMSLRDKGQDLKRWTRVMVCCCYNKLLASSASSLRSPFSRVTWAYRGWPTMRLIR
jgi:hypothetical protein